MQGSCLCGAVRFELEPPSLFCVHCHCDWCRKAHGAAFVTWIGALAERFRLTEDGTLRWYRSSEASERGFCATCGTTLFFRSSSAPGELHATRASIDGPVDREPDEHVFVESMVPWIRLGDDLRRVTRDQPALAAWSGIPRRPPER